MMPPGLTEESFSRLLEFINPDRQEAARRYAKIREKLMRIFEWRGCIPGEDYADETIDRVAVIVSEGLKHRPEKDPYLFFHGVALNVIRESWRRPERKVRPIETLPSARLPLVDPRDLQDNEAVRLQEDQRLECLYLCLDQLPTATRDLLTTYHLGIAGAQIRRRIDLARQLGITAAALRVRLFRARQQLERCLDDCLARRTKHITQKDQ